MRAIVGREAELAAVHAFVEGIADGASALVLEGDAGMGKTTLWNAGIEHAETQGVLVLRARPCESETALSFAGVGDLLDPVLDAALEPLPEGQRRALARALVLEAGEGPPPDPRAVGIAVLSALRALADARPTVLAVDDAHWLDAPSASVLAYAARRLEAERVGVLLARRTPLESSLVAELARSLPDGRFSDLEVGPLDVSCLHRVVQDQLGVVLPRPLLAEVHMAAGGNPFYALEIVRTLKRSGVSVEAGHPLPVPDTLHDLVHGRLLALPDESRRFLLAAAAYSNPTVAITESASGVPRSVGLPPATEAGVVELDGDRIRFEHPLLAAGAYETAAADDRKAVHARLAELLEDPEARAWQLAASVDRGDGAAAAVLEEAAHHARARGAPRPAALLLERASELTPADRPADACRRAVDAAYLHYESGDSPRAEAQLRELIGGLPFGRQRARAMMRLARVRAYESLPDSVGLFLQAVDEAEGDQEILAVAHEGVASGWQRYRQLADAAHHAELAADLALELGDRGLAAEALGTRFEVELLLGRETAHTTMGLALALQDAAEDRRVIAQPRFAAAAQALGWTGPLEPVRDELAELVRRMDELGDESSRPCVLAHLSLVECELGQYEVALSHALEGQDASEQSGQQTMLALNLAVESFVEARRGCEDRARLVAQRALDLVPATGGGQAELVATWALGHLDLVLGHPSAAVARLEPLPAVVRREGITEPCAVPVAVDQIEARAELGAREHGAELLDWYEGNARRLERASALANCARCRGQLAAQAGDLDAALAAFEEALTLHEQVELPLDRGRTLLALGATQRRAKRRREARETLEEAVAVFDRIGAALWAERARAELRRISGRAPSAGALTPAEERVAALVAEGKTNREVAAALYLSERPVEGHLSRVFGKLRIRHRSELAGALASRQSQGVSASNPGDSPVSAGSASS